MVGLSRKEHLNFWNKERNFNFFGHRMISWFTLVVGLIYCVPLFLSRFDVPWVTYILVQTFNAFYCVYTVYSFQRSVYMTTIFALQTIRLFSLKFRSIGRRLALLDALEAKKCNNRLARLIHEFNRVQLELIETNDFFKNYLGFGMLSCFSMAILCMFLSTFLDWFQRVALLSGIFVLYLTTILVPFCFADCILVEVIQLHFVLAVN